MPLRILNTPFSHISPFVFTQYLLPLLKQTAQEPDDDVRIVNVSCSLRYGYGLTSPITQVSSNGHRFVSSGTRFSNLEDLNREFPTAQFPGISRYCKLPSDLSREFRQVLILFHKFYLSSQTSSGQTSCRDALTLKVHRSLRFP